MFVFLLFLLFQSSLQGETIDIHGCLTCNGKPATDVKIDIWEEDWFDPDDHLNFSFTDQNGCFVLEAREEEWLELLGISPYVLISHQCSKDSSKLCSYIHRVDIPPKCASHGISFNLTLELADIQEQEVVACTENKTTTVPNDETRKNYTEDDEGQMTNSENLDGTEADPKTDDSPANDPETTPHLE